MDLYRLTIQDSQDTMQFDLLDAPINIEDVEGAVDNTVLSGDIFTDFLYLKKRWEQKWAIMCKDEYERLRGFYTRQWSLATVPSVKVTQGYLKNTEWEGQIIYINAPYGGEVSALTEMTGDTFQQSFSGKNLYPYPVAIPASLVSHSPGATVTASTTAITITNDSSTTNGFAPSINQGSGELSSPVYVTLPQNTTVTLSFKTSRSTGIKLIIYGYNSGSNNHSNLGTATTNSMTFNTGSRTQFALRFGNTVAGSSLTYSDIMIELGGEVSEFEPYFGIHSPNPTYPQIVQTVTGEQTISINGTEFKINLGKNLFDKTAVTSGYYINSNGTTSPSSNFGCSDYIQVVPNAKYYYSGSTNLSGNAARLAWYRGDMSFISAETYENEGVLTAPKDAAYFRTSIRLVSGSGQAQYLDTYQFEAGDQKTDYAEYFTPYKLASIESAQDSIYSNGSDWIYRQEVGTDTRNVQINGISGNSSTDTTASAKGAFSILKAQVWGADYDTTLGVAKISSNLGIYKLDTSVTGNASAENMQDGTFCQRQGTNDRCYFRATSLIGKTGNEVRAILANQGGVNARWALVTPTETTITDQALIAQLEAVRAALIEGQNLVEVTANGSNLPAKSITLQGIEGRENPILPQTNVRIGLSDGGVLNACECRQNVTLSMRETA